MRTRSNLSDSGINGGSGRGGIGGAIDIAPDEFSHADSGCTRLHLRCGGQHDIHQSPT